MKKLIASLIIASVFSVAALAQFDQVQKGITGNKIIEDGKEFYLYKVKEREGFYSLERKFGVSRVEIVEYNPQVAQGLKLGQIIKIPVVQGRNSTESELEESGNFIYHTVEKGQTLFFISRKYGVSEEDIFKYNPQAKSILITGTELKIPVQFKKPEEQEDDAYIYHAVKPGETLYAIAGNYNKPVKSVLDANPGLESSDIPVGTEIRIPRKVVEINPSLANENKVEETKDSSLYIFEDSTYYYHKIKPKETFYSIISQYHVDKQAVLAVNNIANPQNLNIGYIIKIPKAAILEVGKKTEQMQDENHLVYTVQERRESLSDIADKFSVTVDELKAANSNVPWWGRYKRGDLVRIPQKEKIAYRPDKKETGSRRKRNLQFVKDSILLAEAFIAGCDTLYNDQAVNVAVLWPFYLEANDTFNTVKEINKEGDTIVSVKDPLEVYPSLDPLGFREFYEGIILAVDSLRRMGQDINLYTYDTSNDSDKVQQILAQPEMLYMDLIIGPVYTSNVKMVSDFCLKNQIKQVIPYSSSDELTYNNPYVFQVNPFKAALFEPSISYIVDNFKGSNIIVAYSGEKSESNMVFINNLKRQLFRVGLDHYQPVSFKEVDVKLYGFQGLEKVIDPEKHNLVVLPPESTTKKRFELFNDVVPTVENLVKKRGLTNITLFGYPDYQKFAGRELQMVFKSNTVLYTPFYVDFTSPTTKNVLRQFRSEFYTDPSSDFPYYGFLGFDIAYYFLTAFHEFGPDFDRCLPYLDINLTTSGFNFQRVNNWSGMVNTNINFLNYTRDFDIVKLNYKPVVKPLDIIEFTTNAN